MNRRTALRLLALALVVGIATDILFRGHALGLNVPLNAGILVAAAVLAAGPARLRGIDPFDWWLAPGALAFAAFLAIRTDPVLVLADVAGTAALGAAFLATLGGIRVTRATFSAVLALPFEVAVASVAGGVPVVAAARPARSGAPRSRRGVAGMAAVLRGLLLVIPLVVVFAALFAAADAVFADVAGRILDLPLRLPLADLAERTAWIAAVAWVAAGLLALGAGILPRVLHDAPEAAAAPEASPGSPVVGHDPSAGFGRTEALVILLGLDLLFGGFVGLQVAYLFGGADTLAAAGLTYAEYARRGFFELLAASALAAMVVAGLQAVVPDTGRVRRAAAVLLLALTAVVLVSSFLRLRLYQEMYGWTELRFWVLLSIGWLGASLAAMAVLVATRRSGRMVHAVVLLGVVAVLASNVVSPQRLVAEQNLSRALDPTLVPAGGGAALDGYYLGVLDDDAIPAIVAALPGLPAEQQAYLREMLVERRWELEKDPSLAGWPAWNLGRARALEALASVR